MDFDDLGELGEIALDGRLRHLELIGELEDGPPIFVKELKHRPTTAKLHSPTLPQAEPFGSFRRKKKMK